MIETPVADEESLIGTEVGGYRLITELGNGGMGTVYFGEHLLIGRRSAIKILHTEFAQDEDLLERFLTEARAVNDIRHPNVVEITDIGRINNRPYIVMELLEGETLGERLEREGTLQDGPVVRITRQMASALGTAHERGIIHRDLKPENIFLTNHPDFPDHLKLLDFGIAKLIGPTKSGKKTRVGMLLGTPTYMSPEQCRGEEEIGPASDIYSLGIVLYEMVCGRPPFMADNLNRIIIAHATEMPSSPLERKPDVAPWLSELIMRMLAKAPSSRPANMREVRELLEPARPARVVPVVQQPASSVQEVERREEVEAHVVVNKLVALLLKRLEEDRLSLPSMPGIAAECMQVLQNSIQTFATVARVVERDPHLASRVLKLANSAAFQSRHPATSIEQAISRVGTGGLTAALVEFSLHEVFVSRNNQIRSAFRGMWEHSLAVALLSKDIATSHGKGEVDPSTAYLGGLLHDIGKPVVASFLLDAEKMMDPDTAKAEWLTESVWKKVIDGAHRTVGQALARKWELAPEVADVIGKVDKYNVERPRCSVNVVRLANALAKREGLYVGKPNEAEMHEAIGAGRTLLGLNDEDLARTCNNLYGRVGTLVDGKAKTDDKEKAKLGEKKPRS